MSASSCGSFFICLLSLGIKLDVVVARSDLAPVMSPEKTVNVGQRDLASQTFTYMTQHVFGGQHIACGGTHVPLLEHRLFFSPSKKSPASSTASLPPESFRALVVVFADPFPDTGQRNLQKKRDLLRVHLSMVRHPYGQSALIAGAVGHIMHPVPHFIVGQVRFDQGRWSHVFVSCPYYIKLYL